ncbi:MAG: porin [Ramlibacter sp.]|nr:porin [Ramlibacter sp.]
MKSGLMRAAALAAAVVAGGAHAQSSVQLLGTMDAFVGSRRAAGDPGRVTVVNSGGMTTSWIGFKGTEDLGGGLKANFALTSFLQVDTGQPGRFGGDPMFSRDANVGLAGGFGAVTIGRALAPNFLPTVILNPFGDSFTFSPLVLHANVPLFNGTGWAATTPSDTGWSNEFIYSTPKWGGLSGNVHYQLGEVPGSTGPHNAGFNVLYFGGPLTAGAFYESAQISNPLPAPFTTGDKKTDWMVGGAYDFTVVKAFLTYGKVKSDKLVPAARTASLGASVPLGAGSILAGIARTNVAPASTRRTTTTIGYDYSMSKSTDVYAMAMHDAITAVSSGNSYGVGIRKRF